MLNPINMNELNERAAITPENRNYVVSLVEVRKAEEDRIKQIKAEIERLKRGVESFEEKVRRGKKEIQRLKAMARKSRKTKEGLTNRGIAEKLEIPVQQVRGILHNRTSYK